MPHPDAIPLSRTATNFHGFEYRIGMAVKVVRQSDTVNRFVGMVGLAGTVQGFAQVSWQAGQPAVLCIELLSYDRQRGYVPLGCLEPDDATMAPLQRAARKSEARAVRRAAKETGLDVEDVEDVLAAYSKAKESEDDVS